MRATGLESSFHYTYRREVYASGQEVFMTQRVARPMKFAAFISIIISMAVMLAACQGAVGPKGDKGDTGDKGTDGTDGVPGSMGHDALVVKAYANPPVISVSDQVVANVDQIGDLSSVSASAADWFAGGTPPVTYSLVKYGTPLADFPANSVFIVAVDKDTGAITLTARKASNVEPVVTVSDTAEGNWIDGTRFIVKATDANGVTAQTPGPPENGDATSMMVSVKRNRAPLASTAARDATGRDNAAATNKIPVTVGTMDGFAAGATDPQKADACNRLDTSCVTAEANPLSLTLASYFIDEDKASLMYTPSTSPYVSASVSSSGVLMVKGVKAGDPKDGVPQTRIVDLEVKATDAGNLPSVLAAVFTVTIDPPPERKAGSQIPSPAPATGITSATAVLSGLDRFIVDNAPDTLVYAVKETSDPSEVLTTVVIDGVNSDNVRDSEGSVAIHVTTAAHAGDATIEVTVTDGVGQHIKIPLTVKVTAP